MSQRATLGAEAGRVGDSAACRLGSVEKAASYIGLTIFASALACAGTSYPAPSSRITPRTALTGTPAACT